MIISICIKSQIALLLSIVVCFVLGSDRRSEIVLSEQFTSQETISLTIDHSGANINVDRGSCSWQQIVKQFHGSSDLVVQDIENFLLLLLFAEIEWTQVQPEDTC